MTSIDTYIEFDKLCSWLDLKTEISKKCLKDNLLNWKNDINNLHMLTSKFRKFKEELSNSPEFHKECLDIFNEISEYEKRIQQIIHSDTDLEKESYGELLFLNPFFKPFNFIPMFLSIWAIIRIYVLPGISILIPFLTLIAPYLIIRFIFNAPITFTNYSNMLMSMISGKFGNLLNPTSITQNIQFDLSSIIKQVGVLSVTFIQGIIQPYWTYKHLYSIDNIIQTNGDIIFRFRNLYNKLDNLLSNHGFSFFKCPIPDIKSDREAIASVLLNSTYYKLALKYIGNLEIIIKLASHPDTTYVKWISNIVPYFSIYETYDYNLNIIQRKSISYNSKEKNHALLTGPNKGGKSTVLRALSSSLLLAHTYGCVIGKYSEMTPFHNLFVCLKPDDLPGSKSRFEREIEFTANTLQYNIPTIILIDELYHSTNPPDALRACDVYCNKLWKKNNLVSIISTHLFDLVDKAPKNINKICCPATIENNKLDFSYELQNGVCKVSSVDELLEKNGLI